MKTLLTITLLIGSIALDLLRADDPVIPGAGFSASHYQDLWTKSPFAVASPEAVAVSVDYALVGIAQFDGIYYVSLVDKQSNEHFVLTTDQPTHGLKLTSVTPGHNGGDTTALIQRNGEALTLKLEQSALPPSMMANNPGIPVSPLAVPMPGATQQVQMPMPGAGGAFPGATARPPARFRRPQIHVPPYPGGTGQNTSPVPQPPPPPNPAPNQ